MAEAPGRKAFATWLDTRMRDLHIKQADVARAVGTDGVQVMRWRRGTATPTPKFLSGLADYFGVELVDLERLAYLPASSGNPTSTQIDAERQLWRARYDSLMDKKVPKWAWRAYMEACEALADAYNQMRPGELSTPANESLSKRSGTTDDGRPDADLGKLADTCRPRKSTLLSARSTALATAG